jgi:hypothetical protein
VKNSGGDKETAAGANYKHSFGVALSLAKSTSNNGISRPILIGCKLRPAEFLDSGEQLPISSAAETG